MIASNVDGRTRKWELHQQRLHTEEQRAGLEEFRRERAVAAEEAAAQIALALPSSVCSLSCGAWARTATHLS